jgi:NAD-dependent dihydropyrimidine dehydrogenase PreA subunit
MVTDEAGKPLYKDYADYIVNHQRKPGVGPLSGWRGENGDKTGRRRTQPEAARALHREWRLFDGACAGGGPVLQARQPGLERLGDRARVQDSCRKHLPALFSSRCGNSNSRQKARQASPARASPRTDQALLRSAADAGTRRSRTGWSTQEPIRCTRSPSVPPHMYHSWGSQNAWLRQITARTPLCARRCLATGKAFADGDWALVTSPPGRNPGAGSPHGCGQRRRSGPGTPSASARAPGRWARRRRRPPRLSAQPLIDELLPPKGDGRRWANSDPITGQAAWFDLRVSIRRDPDQSGGSASLPPDAQTSPVGSGPRPRRLRAGEGRMTSLPGATEKRLGLVIDLDTCVGCHACAVNARNGTRARALRR